MATDKNKPRPLYSATDLEARKLIEDVKTNKLDKGVGLKVSNAKELEEQIENLSVDFVIASGIDYTKWNSGKLECFGRCSVSTAGKLNNLPKSFIDQYYMIAINPDSTSDTTTFLATGNRKSVDSFIGICANFASQGHTSSYYAVGRWK